MAASAGFETSPSEAAIPAAALAEHDLIRATSVVNGIALLKEKLGAERFAAMVQRLEPAPAALLRRRILAVEWLPMADWVSIFEAAAEDLHKNDPEQTLALLHELCALDFNTVYRFFLRLAPKAMLLSRAGKIWKTYHTVGTLSALEEKQVGKHHRLRYTLTDYEPIPIVALALQAYVGQIITMMGARSAATRVERCDVVDNRLAVEVVAEFDEAS